MGNKKGKGEGERGKREGAKREGGRGKRNRGRGRGQEKGKEGNPQTLDPEHRSTESLMIRSYALSFP